MSDYRDDDRETDETTAEPTPKKKFKPFAPAQVFGTSAKKESEGTWVNVGDQAFIKIRRVNYPPAKEHLRKLLKPHATAIKMDTFNDDLERPILVKVLVSHLVVGWKGMYETETNPDGSVALDSDGDPIYKPLPYSQDNARTLFTKTPDFVRTVWGLCEDAQNFKEQADQEDAKN